MITCGDCLRALHPYVDRELSDEDVAQVKLHLEACGPCLHLFAFEASLRRLVRVACREQTAPEGLRSRVLAKLTEERVRLERPRRATPRRPSEPA